MYFVILSNIISGFLISIYAIIFVLTMINKFKNIENINITNTLQKETDERYIDLNYVVIDIMD